MQQRLLQDLYRNDHAKGRKYHGDRKIVQQAIFYNMILGGYEKIDESTLDLRFDANPRYLK